MNKDRYISVRVNEEFSEELEKVLGQRDRDWET